MKAIVQTRYGSPDVLELREVEKPVPADDEVLVRARAASMHPDVWHVVSGQPYVLRLMGAGFTRPKNPIPGTDLAGHVESVGKNVTRFRPGDEVFGESIRGYQWVNGGAYAEYVRCPESALKPPNVTFEQAASVPTAGLIALQNLANQAKPRPGQKILVNGAAGGVGSIALQVAKAAGAEVTAVDTTEKLDLLRTLGADHVIDYTQQDYAQGSERYDLLFDVPGNHPFSVARRALRPDGIYVLIMHDHFGTQGRRLLGSVPRGIALMASTPFRKQLPKIGAMPRQQESIATLAELLEAGELTPIVARTYPLQETADALRFLQTGAALGRIIITIPT